MKNSINNYPPPCGKPSRQVASSAKHIFIFSLMLMLFQNAPFMAQAQTDPPNALAPGFGNSLTDDGTSPNWIANNFLRIDPLSSGTASSFTASLGSGTFTLRVGENYGSLSSTTDVRALFYGGNVGLVHSGSFGNGTSASSKWQGIGERIPVSGTAGTNFYGIRNQWGVYASNFGSRDRNSGSQTDAIVTWQDGSYSSVSSADTASNRMIFTSVISDNAFNIIERELGTMLGNGNFGLGTDNPQYLMDLFGTEGKSRLRIRTGANDGFIMGFTGNNFALNNTLNGNINFVTNGSARMSITNLGGVRIGASTQTGTMQIVNNQATGTNAIFELTDLTTPFLYVRDDGFVCVGTNAPLTISATFFSNNGGTPPWAGTLISASPLFSVSGGDIETDGDLFAQGNVYIQSDGRLKTNINPLQNWKSILSLDAYSYNFKNNSEGPLSYGFIAQDVNKIMPELTATWREAGAVNYIGFIPFLFQGVKQHEADITEISKVNKELEGQITLLNEEAKLLKSDNELLREEFKVLQTQMNSLLKLINSEKEKENGSNGQGGTLNDRAELYQNLPNPFSEKTVIPYYLPANARRAIIKVSNMEGITVGNFIITIKGHSFVEIQAGTLSSGTYHYSLIVDEQIIDTKQLIVSK